MDDRGHTRPTVPQLRDETGCGAERIRSALKTLVKKGLIRRLGRKRRYEGVTYQIVRRPPSDPSDREGSDYSAREGSQTPPLGRGKETEKVKGESAGGESESPRHPPGARGASPPEPDSPGARGAIHPDLTQNVEVIRFCKHWLRSFNITLGVPPDKHYKVTGKYGRGIVLGCRELLDMGYTEGQIFSLIPKATDAYDAGEGVRAYYRPDYVLKMAPALLAGEVPEEAREDE